MKPLLFALLLIPGISVYAAKPHPIDNKATKETVNLYRNLLKLQKEGLMFGHQDDLAYGKGWIYEEGRSDVKDVCGDYPAVYGWELGHLELGNAYNLDSVHFDKIREWIKITYARGGVNTISWHLRNPHTGNTAWDKTSTESVAAILPGGESHQKFLEYLDRLADFLLSLKTDDGTYIPVIFRPFHEHTGSWFWWGRDFCTIDEYKALWHFTESYLKDTKNIHHLLYSYSTDKIKTQEEYLERYPGDNFIDVLAIDLYDKNNDYKNLLDNCAKIVSGLANEKNKVGAISEAGGRIMTNTEWWTKTVLEVLSPYNLSYILVWRNPANSPERAFAPYKGHPSTDDFIKFYNDKRTLFQKDIKLEKLYQRLF